VLGALFAEVRDIPAPEPAEVMPGHLPVEVSVGAIVTQPVR
jgi:hypothetical protein